VAELLPASERDLGVCLHNTVIQTHSHRYTQRQTDRHAQAQWHTQTQGDIQDTETNSSVNILHWSVSVLETFWKLQNDTAREAK